AAGWQPISGGFSRNASSGDDALFLQVSIDPAALVLALQDRVLALPLALSLRSGRGEQCVEPIGRHRDQPILVADDQIARFDHETADCNRHIDLARTFLEGTTMRIAARIAWEVRRIKRGDIAYCAIDHEAGKTTHLRMH